MRAPRRLLAAVLLGAALAASADEMAVRRMLQEKLRDGGRIEAVQKLPGVDLYEVTIRTAAGPLLYYVDGGATVIIAGPVIDAKTGRNLTEERQRKLSAIAWESLPLQWAITSVRGSGRRKIAILSDPNCPYCKRLEQDLATLDDITVHILPFPVLGAESVRLAKAVWCAQYRARAWNDLMFRRIEPPGAANCDTPVERLQEYGRRIGANSTPTWFLESGERFSGALPLEQVRRLLDVASPARR